MTSAQIVQQFALENIPSAPIARQVELYRALAELAATPSERAELRELAQSAEELRAHHAELELRHQQLVMDFRLKST